MRGIRAAVVDANMKLECVRNLVGKDHTVLVSEMFSYFKQFHTGLRVSSAVKHLCARAFLRSFLSGEVCTVRPSQELNLSGYSTTHDVTVAWIKC